MSSVIKGLYIYVHISVKSRLYAAERNGLGVLVTCNKLSHLKPPENGLFIIHV